ncbi:MAG: HAD-IC family P-type ATPase, partial [Desulfuromonadales bacterium]|nr:HAD-IC family P-type ATPase [Desulfuromonadales bacterium]
RGILFRGGDILEKCARVEVAAFDKTGTLTLGKPLVTEIVPAPGVTQQQLLQRAAAAEYGAKHPIAHGIVQRAKDEGIAIPSQQPVTTVAGRGLRQNSAEGEVLVGSRSFLLEAKIEVPELESGLKTEVHVSLDGRWLGALLLQDTLRPEAKTALTTLQQTQINSVLLTGDRAATAQQIGAEVGMEQVHSQLSPEQKADWVRQRQRDGAVVMMVGDGINDAPALSLADVGCAMAGGADIALETSDLVLNRPDLNRLCEALLIARKTLQTIKQNLFWAFGYNMVTIPLAACGKLAPVWAAAAMAASSVLVVGNSLRLGRTIRRTFNIAKASTKD